MTSSPPTLLFLLGNRDLQVPKQHPLAESVLIKKFFGPHNDDLTSLIIRKDSQAWFTFEEASREVWSAYEEIKTAVRFPMIEQSLHWLTQSHPKWPRPRLVFCTTRQQPVHAQDCYALAQFAERYFAEQGYEGQCRFFAHNPNDFEGLVAYFNALFQELNQQSLHLLISNSGGTPTMRSASHLSGIFRGFTYLQVETGDKVNLTTFAEQERLILTEIVEKQLAMFDYQGIQLLPGLPETVREACARAQNLYNLKDSQIDPTLPYDQQAEAAIRLIYSNLRVCFHRGGYADAIGRIFRLEEALGQLLLYRLLQEQGLVDERGQVQSPVLSALLPYPVWLSDKGAKIRLLEEHFASILIDNERGRGKAFAHTPAPAPLAAVANGKNLFYFVFRGLGRYRNLYDLLARINQQYIHDPDPNAPPPTLSKLRNHSLLGHGHAGINRADLERVLGPYPGFEAFCVALEAAVEQDTGIPLENLFVAENEKIRNFLQSAQSNLERER